MLILLCTVKEKQVLVYKRLDICCRLHCVNI